MSHASRGTGRAALQVCKAPSATRPTPLACAMNRNRLNKAPLGRRTDVCLMQRVNLSVQTSWTLNCTFRICIENSNVKVFLKCKRAKEVKTEIELPVLFKMSLWNLIKP